MHKFATFLLTGLLGWGFCPSARACTTFKMGQGKKLVVGKSYDWHHGDGLAFVNKRGLKKTALLLPHGGTTPSRPARWTSRYGSVTFSQHGRDFPLGGMNEAGLVMEIMWLRATRYPKPVRNKPTLNELQLIQYVLDSSATTAEALKAIRNVQVARVYARVHYLVCDGRGDCATVEFLDGRLVVHRGKQLPAAVLTNAPYGELAKELHRYRGFGGQRIPPTSGQSSQQRFYCAAGAVTRYRGDTAPQTAAFAILDQVRAPHWSRWQLVYQPTVRRIAFRKAGSREAPVTISLASEDFDCHHPTMAIDITGAFSRSRGKHFVDLPKHSLALLRLAVRQLKLPLPPQLLAGLAQHSRSARCEQKARAH